MGLNLALKLRGSSSKFVIISRIETHYIFTFYRSKERLGMNESLIPTCIGVGPDFPLKFLIEIKGISRSSFLISANSSLSLIVRSIEISIPVKFFRAGLNNLTVGFAFSVLKIAL